MRRGRVLLLLMLLAGASAAGLYRWATPGVLEISPAPEATDGPAAAEIRLTFSRPMDPESVEQRLRVEPAVAGSLRWEENTLVFAPDDRWPSGSSVQVSLAPGSRSTLRLTIGDAQSWSFTVEPARVAYLWPSDGPADIYALEPITGAIEQLTTTANGVSDFSVAPDGLAIYYSVHNSAGGTDLYRLDRRTGQSVLLLACPDALCQMPQLSPDGSKLAFQRTGLAGHERASPSEIRIRAPVPDPDDLGELVQSLERQSRTLAWSTTGLLAFHDAVQGVYVFFDPETGDRARFTNLTGEPGSWSPASPRFIAPEILPEAASAAGTGGATSHLIEYDSANGQILDLTLSDLLEDTEAVYSPDGGRLAFARRYLDSSRWTPGRQLWVMRADGMGAVPLTESPHFQHAEFAWNPDGSQLAFKRFNQLVLTDPPEIWLVQADGSDPIRLIIGGYEPQWLP